MIIINNYYYYAAFNAPCVGHKDEVSVSAVLSYHYHLSLTYHKDKVSVSAFFCLDILQLYSIGLSFDWHSVYFVQL